MLFKKFGLPHAMIWRINFRLKRGLLSRSCILPNRNGPNAIRAQTNIPLQVAAAAPQTSQRNTNRNTNSRMALSADIKIFSPMLKRIFPQIRR